MLALPASGGEDPPKAKEGAKEKTPKERFAALAKDFNSKRQAILAEARKATGEDQQKLIKQYRALGGEFADQFLKLAEDHPKDPVAADAVFWVVENADGTPAHRKAAEKVTALIGEMPLKDLGKRLEATQPTAAVLDAVLKRAEKDEKDPQVADLVAWAATNAYYLPAGQKAVRTMFEKYPDHEALERVVSAAAEMRGGDALLKQLLEKDPKPKVKAAATLGLGKALAEKVDGLGEKPAEADKMAGEAEKYLTSAVELYKDNEARRKEAEREIKALRTLRVGKEAPDIKGPDLDGKDFKLTDYRGKVVLLDFWGDW